MDLGLFATFVSSDLMIAFSGGGAFLQVHSLQDGILPEFVLDTDDGLLHLAIPLQFCAVLKEAVLVIFFRNHIVTCDIDAVDRIGRIDDPAIEVSHCGNEQQVRVGVGVCCDCAMGGSNIEASGITYVKGKGAGDKILLYQIQTEQIHHLFYHQQSLVEGIITAKHLAAPQAVGLWSVGFDICHGDRFPAPRMVDQKLGIDAKKAVEEIFVGLGNGAHGSDAVRFQAPGGTGADPPEIREGLVVPELIPVAFFVQFSDKIVSVFGGDVQGDLGQIEIRSDTAGSANAGSAIDICHDLLAQFAGGESVQRQVIRYIHEGLVDRIYVNIFFGDILQIDGVNIGGRIDVFLHTRWRDRIFDCRRDLEETTAVLDSKRFHGRRNGQTDGLLCPVRVGYDQIFSHGIHASGDTFHRSIEGFQVDTQISTLFHKQSLPAG